MHDGQGLQKEENDEEDDEISSESVRGEPAVEGRYAPVVRSSGFIANLE